MPKKRTTDYGNDSISSLKGADRVRKRPGVIFGSDGLEGCEHAVFLRFCCCHLVSPYIVVLISVKKRYIV